jgi:DNA-binding LytR/AlgR family response regulator
LKKILLIHSNNEQDSEFREVLESAGYGTYVSAGESDGLKIAYRYSPDIIVCELDDFEKELKIIKMLNDTSTTKCIPLLLITSTTQTIHTRAAMELGADDVLVKPFNNDSLLKSIKKRLQKIELLKIKLTDQIVSAENVFSGQPIRTDHILITIGKKLKLIEFSRIECITALKEYSKIITDDECKIIVRKSIRSWIEILPSKDFLRIHRATIVNMSYLDRIEKNGNRSYNVHLKNILTPFPMSQRYSNIMRKIFSV